MKFKVSYKVLYVLIGIFAALSYAVECMASGDIIFDHRDYECEDLSQYRVNCRDENGKPDGSCSGYNFREKSQLIKRVEEHRAEVIQLTPQDEAADRKKSKQHAEKMQKIESEHLSELKAEMKKNKDNGKKSRERYIREQGGTLYVGEKAYRTIRIGTQNWMAEGLQQGACPDGWHIPSYKDWKTLIKFVENDNNHPFSELYAVRALLSLDDEWNVIDSSSAWDSTRVFSLDYYSEYKWMTYKAIHYGTDNYGFSLNKSGEQFRLSRRVKDTWVSVCAVDDRSGEGVTMRIYSTVTGHGGEGLPHIDNFLHFNEDKDCEMRCVEDDEEKARLEQERLERERIEQERLEQERLERERIEQERLEQERLEQEKREQERLKIRNKYIYENGGTFVDKRDGREYRGIQIGDRIWMAENLKFENKNSSAHEPHLGLNSACLEDGSGCYYQWMLAQGQGLPGLAVEACPSGWRLPDTSDVNALFRAVGGRKNAAKSLKQNGSWSKNGPDLYGFSLEHMPYPNDPGGKYGYALWKDGVPFWTSTEVEKRFSYKADDLVWTMFFEDNGDAASVQTSPKGAYLPIRCVAKSEKKSGIVWNDGESSHKDRLLNVKQEEGKMQDASEKKEDETRKRLNEKKVKQGPHIAFLGGFPLMEGQPGYRGYKGMNKVNSLIEGEAGYKVSYYWFVLGLNLGVTYMNFTRADKKQNFSYFYLGIPVSVRYPFTELFYVSGGVTYKRMLQFLGYPSYSEYIAMSGNTFLFSVSLGVMKGHWDFGLVVGTEYLGDEKSNRGENFRNRYLNIGINADCWF